MRKVWGSESILSSFSAIIPSIHVTMGSHLRKYSIPVSVVTIGFVLLANLVQGLSRVDVVVTFAMTEEAVMPRHYDEDEVAREIVRLNASAKHPFMRWRRRSMRRLRQRVRVLLWWLFCRHRKRRC